MHEYGDYGALRQLVGQFLERTDTNGHNNFPCSIEKYQASVRSAA